MNLWRRNLPLYILVVPGLLFFVIFRYIPMFGIVIAFQQYDLFGGIWNSQWIGLEHFRTLFGSQEFWGLMRNTLVLSFFNLFLFFPVPILLALLLNEARNHLFRRSVQTIVYLPHFLSWVIIVSITIILFAPQGGGINVLLESMGLPKWRILISPDAFPWLYITQNIWKESGWSAIIFLAALASVDPALHEAATVDGASRLRQVWHISLPALRSTIVILFILRLGQVMEIGFEHIYLIQNAANRSVSDVFDTFVYRTGVINGQFDYTTAVGLFKSLIGLILILMANWTAKKFGEEGVY